VAPRRALRQPPLPQRHGQGARPTGGRVHCHRTLRPTGLDDGHPPFPRLFGFQPFLVACVFDVFSRMPLAAETFTSEPTADEITTLFDRTAQRLGRAVSDLPWHWHGILSLVGGSTHMTQEEREESRRHFGVLTEDLRSQIQQVAEGVTANGEAIRRSEEHTARELAAVRAETAAGFAAVHTEIAAVRSEADAFRVETTRNFAAVHTEFAAVRSEAEAFRDETARNFAAVRSEMASNRTGAPVPRRPRTRRRPN